jgi:hypothetical protein
VGENKPPPDDATSMTSRQVYNVVSDTVGGPNVRLRDNLFQAAAIFAGMILGAGIGALVATERIFGALAGGFLGLLAGLFGSGIFLMVYRAVKHTRGKHD